MVRAYAGASGVLLAFNFSSDDSRKGCLGFSVQRKGPNGAAGYLDTMVPFKGQAHNPGDPIPSNAAPVQKFRWSDYEVDPDTAYTYTVSALYGSSGALEAKHTAVVEITTQGISLSEDIGAGKSPIAVFNRAVASSQAFSRKFPQTTKKLNTALAKPAPKSGAKKTDGILTQAEMDWLSHGLKEQIVAFIQQAKGAQHALDIAIYQYELPDIYEAVNKAYKAGVQVRLIYHAKKGDAQTAKNETAAAGLPAAAKFGRVTAAIFHHKFIVFSDVKNGKRTPRSVLCGSTNFTLNGVCAQANNVVVTADPTVMQKYVDQFDFLFEQPAHTPAVTSTRDSEQNILDPALPLQAGFSPRQGKVDLTVFASLINAAKHDVMFATAFGLDPIVMNALKGQPDDSILRYGIQDKPTKDVTGTHADSTADFEAASALPAGIEGWLDEHRMPGQEGSILIHDKIIVIDFTSDTPIVIDGSHNYSANASRANDENYLIVRNDTDFADRFGVEVLRIYDHYRYRYVTKQKLSTKTASGTAPGQAFYLDETDGWTQPYYDPTSLKYADRLAFSGQLAASAAHGADRPTIQQIREKAGAPGTAGGEVKPVKAVKPAPKKKVAVKHTHPAHKPIVKPHTATTKHVAKPRREKRA
jgi:phosphatidylserine/phosphatidylglycerophosphate/cardiolipin synthase-like enzyme